MDGPADGGTLGVGPGPAAVHATSSAEIAIAAGRARTYPATSGFRAITQTGRKPVIDLSTSGHPPPHAN